ncbi:hypothetical protein L2747_12775 [Shewanella marinintestina]|uniref:hypothetical protein n=1 Tax=Shewanella marinintestina TaxID=190305 RepID=UPI00200C1959|nr:hypothetical protein [Shewanella marinintestina]MCL1146873.1 hypothetical protein [Shewanella marinintestina]
MQQEFPIRVMADGNFSNSLTPLLAELEMWVNFQALKADWYGDEDFILSFDFTLVRTLEENDLSRTPISVSEESLQNAANERRWVVESGYAYVYDSHRLVTTALIAVDDLLKGGAGIEQAIKARLLAVANAVGALYELQELS